MNPLRRIFLSCLAAGALISSHAQIKLGFLGGISFSDLSRQPTDPTYSNGGSLVPNGAGGIPITYSLMAGGHFAILAQIPLGPHVALMPSLLWELKGGGSESYYSTAYSDFSGPNTRIPYLVIPVSLTLLSNSRSGGWFAGIGPYLGIARSETENGMFETLGNTAKQDSIRRGDFGLDLAAGYEMPLGLFFEIRYELGLQNILPQGNSQNYIRTKCFSISLGWLFPITQSE